MKRIDEYIDILYKNRKGDPKEIEELKIEMKNHLIEAVEELKNEGHSEQSSINIAIERFGDENEIGEELTEVFNSEIRFSKVIFKVSILALIISIVAFIGYRVSSKTIPFTLKVPKEFKIIENKIKEGEKISQEEVTNILLKYNKQFRYVVLFKENNSSISSVYPSEFSIEEIQKDKENYLEKSFYSVDGTEWIIRYGFISEGFYFIVPLIMKVVSIVLFCVYWIGFGVWCIINAWNKKKLNLAWGILFVLFNVLAFGVFLIDKKSKLRSVS